MITAVNSKVVISIFKQKNKTNFDSKNCIRNMKMNVDRVGRDLKRKLVDSQPSTVCNSARDRPECKPVKRPCMKDIRRIPLSYTEMNVDVVNLNSKPVECQTSASNQSAWVLHEWEPVRRPCISDITMTPVRDIVLHLLAAKPYTLLDMLFTLNRRDFIKDPDYHCINYLLRRIAKLRNNTYHLKRRFYCEVRQDWPFYNELDLMMLSRRNPYYIPPDHISTEQLYDVQYLLDYGPITDLQQRSRYLDDFHKEFPEYLELYKFFNKDPTKAEQVQQLLNQVNQNEILQGDREIKTQSQRNEAVVRYDFLYHKLFYIKSLLKKHDEDYLKRCSSATPLTTPRV